MQPTIGRNRALSSKFEAANDAKYLPYVAKPGECANMRHPHIIPRLIFFLGDDIDQEMGEVANENELVVNE